MSAPGLPSPADEQLRIWQIEKAYETAPEAARLRLLQERLESQRRVSLAQASSAKEILPTLGGFDLGRALSERRAADSLLSREDLQDRALAEEAELIAKDVAASGDPRKRAAALLKSAPEHLRELVTSDRLRRTAAVAAVDAVAGGGLLFLVGPHDASKSTAGAAALRPSGFWVSGSLLLDHWMDSDHKRRSALLTCQRVTIDEWGRGLGSQKQRAASAEVLVTVLHERSQSPSMTTIVTANLDMAGLQAAISAPREGISPALERWSLVIERLREFGRPVTVSEEVRALGGLSLGPGVVLCPYEGFRGARR